MVLSRVNFSHRAKNKAVLRHFKRQKVATFHKKLRAKINRAVTKEFYQRLFHSKDLDAIAQVELKAQIRLKHDPSRELLLEREKTLNTIHTNHTKVV